MTTTTESDTSPRHLHCGEPMRAVRSDEPPPITEPLVVLSAGVIAERVRPAAEEGTVTYRCRCGFTLDVPLY